MPYARQRYLVAPRGRTEWVRNAEAHGSVQQFFSIPPDANIEEFARIAADHPVFKTVEIAT